MAGTSTPVELIVTAGLPYTRAIRITGGAAIWPELDQFEVRSQVRAGKTEQTALLNDLRPFITKTIVENDIVLLLSMTGAETRTLNAGYYDVILSDPGVTDARAISALSGKIKIKQLVTAASDG